jgi:hypothetical protein
MCKQVIFRRLLEMQVLLCRKIVTVYFFDAYFLLLNQFGNS